MDGTAETNENEIVVTGYSHRYTVAVKKLLRIEGGFVDDPADRGGATKFGVSLRFLQAEGAFDEDGDGVADFDLDMDGDLDRRDIRLLRRSDAVYLYHKCFWQRLDAEVFPAPLGEMLFDQAVNGGLSSAAKLLQRAINRCLMEATARGARAVIPSLTVDGRLGNETRKAVLWVLRYPAIGMPGLIIAYREATKARYEAIVARYPRQRKFLKGWLTRAEELGR